MKGAVLVALVATVGNFLQGWDNATIAGTVVYMKKELTLEATIEGLVVAMSLIGAMLVTTFSGSISDWIGRRPMLILSSLFYFVGGLIMLWSPNVYILLVARLLDGFGIGLAVTLVPLYISETAPSEIRGLLNTLPQFTGCGGMFLAYCMIFGMSLMTSPSWRLLLGVLSIPSFFYFLLTVFYLPESPRWLVSKGRMLEAKQVLQRLRGIEDVSGEMALLVEGLSVGGETFLDEYIIGLDDELADDQEQADVTEHVKLYGPEGVSWVAKPVTGRSSLSLIWRQGSLVNKGMPLMDPLVTLFGSIHEKLPDMGSTHSMLFPNLGSMISMAEPQARHEDWDEESLQREGEGYTSDAAGAISDDDLLSPLISRQTTSLEKDLAAPTSHGSVLSMRRHSSLMQQNAGEAVGSMGIGSGWQLAWKWSEKDHEDGKKGGFKKIYLHQKGGRGSMRGSVVTLPGGDVVADGDYIQAAALVGQPALYSKELMSQHPIGPAMLHPSQTASKGPAWTAVFEPGVRRALIIGIGVQILQQFAGINGVMYYTPQILKQAGVDIILGNLGIGSDSSSFLISALTNFLMLPSIAVAMRFMDVSGRRTLLLTTIPVVIASLVVLVIANVVQVAILAHAVISTVCVVLYFCSFVMGYGPIPNILCAEIFPTRARGLCIAICALVFWICNVIVTYSLPVMLRTIGLAGVFGIYAVVCVISWFFVYLRVPETKGMPLEVIIEFFSVGAKQIAASKQGSY